MVTNFTPLHERILVRRIEEARTTRGGLIPDSAKDKPQEGEAFTQAKGQLRLARFRSLMLPRCPPSDRELR
jgi:co-chaperonin GroES (HSP10)